MTNVGPCDKLMTPLNLSEWPWPTRREMLFASAGLVLASHANALSLPLPAEAHGFDFLLGKWNVRHQHLKKLLAGSSDWEEFPGTLEVQPILHGLGNIDENVIDTRKGQFLATTVRVFDPKSHQWSLYWIDGRVPGIDKPVVGRFSGRIGHFYSDDDYKGRPIKVRFIWRDLGPTRAAWEQAFSVDAGKTWETNWTMDFSRIGRN